MTTSYFSIASKSKLHQIPLLEYHVKLGIMAIFFMEVCRTHSWLRNRSPCGCPARRWVAMSTLISVYVKLGNGVGFVTVERRL